MDSNRRAMGVSPITQQTRPRPNRVGEAQPGVLLQERYRLEELLVQRAAAQTWRAIDVVLARPVTVHLLPADRRHRALIAAARKAAIASDFRVRRVLDATLPGKSTPDDGVGPYIVCEYAPGRTLADLLTEGPLTALEAAWLVREIADTLAGLHASKVYHQSLSPATIFISATGSVKIAGLLDADMSAEASRSSDAREADVTALGTLLYAALTAHWPGGSAHGLPGAPVDEHGNILCPRTLVPSVPEALDQICARILVPTAWERGVRLRNAADVSAALSRVLGGNDATTELAHRVEPVVPSPAEPTADLAVLAADVPESYADLAHHKPAHVDAWRPAEIDTTAPPRPPLVGQHERIRRTWGTLLIVVLALVAIAALVFVGVRLSHFAVPADLSGAASMAWSLTGVVGAG